LTTSFLICLYSYLHSDNWVFTKVLYKSSKVSYSDFCGTKKTLVSKFQYYVKLCIYSINGFFLFNWLVDKTILMKNIKCIFI